METPVTTPNTVEEITHHLNRAGIWSLGNKNGVLVAIDLATGDIKFGEHYTPNEAARVFWEAIANMRVQP